MTEPAAKSIVSIVVPFYNEGQTIECFFKTLLPVLNGMTGYGYEIVCVNDGSSDNTLAKLLEAKKNYGDAIRIIDLSRNFGKEAALTAGIDKAAGDAVIPIDCDLQDPVEIIVALVAKWKEGYEVVLAKRVDRSSDPYIKRCTSLLFYKLFNKISDIDIPEDVGDFRLMSRSAVEALKTLPERRRFMKGLFAWIGFRPAVVEYVRNKRVSGRTKFNYRKLFDFALEAIASFSSIPLRWLLFTGIFVALAAFCYAAWIVTRTLAYGVDVPGYASLITIILFLGGLQLVGLGVIGEYVGRVYMEAKKRPIYIVDKIY